MLKSDHWRRYNKGCCPECSKVNQDEEVLLCVTMRSTKLLEAFEEEDFSNSSALGCCPWRNYMNKRKPYIEATIKFN